MTSHPKSRHQRMPLIGVVAAVALLATGCDPVVNFYGSFFPAWVLALALGIALTGVLRWPLAALRLEPHLGPLVVVYPALAFLLSCVSWLFLFGP